MQNTLRQRWKGSERTWFLLALLFSAMIGEFFKRGQTAMLLYLLVPWGAGQFYVRLRCGEIRQSIGNAFLFAGMAWMGLACLFRQCFDMAQWLPLAIVTLYALLASQPQMGQSADERRNELRAVAMLIVACVTPMMLLGVASAFLGHSIPFLNENLPVGIAVDGAFGDRIRVLSQSQLHGASGGGGFTDGGLPVDDISAALDKGTLRCVHCHSDAGHCSRPVSHEQYRLWCGKWGTGISWRVDAHGRALGACCGWHGGLGGCRGGNRGALGTNFHTGCVDRPVTGGKRAGDSDRFSCGDQRRGERIQQWSG